MTVTRGILCGLAVLALGASPVQGQTTQISTEYLMTLYAPLDPVQEVDSSLAVYNLRREVLTSKDLYFITAPTLQASSKRYAWVNHVQCGKGRRAEGRRELVREVRHLHRALTVASGR